MCVNWKQLIWYEVRLASNTLVKEYLISTHVSTLYIKFYLYRSQKHEYSNFESVENVEP